MSRKSKNIWLISDTHFNHSNILKFDNGRGEDFSCTAEMDQKMVDNWNKVVQPGDKVYHLGDVFFGPKGYFERLWTRLMGNKRLIVGNHDDIKYLSAGPFFQKVSMWRYLGDHGVVLTHVPIHTSGFVYRSKKKDVINVHGHTHRNGSPEGPYKSVCVELTDYTPVHIEEVRSNAK